MNRVLMLGYFFPPSKAAGTFRTLRFVRDLPDRGWRPTILTVAPQTYPAGDHDLALLHKVPNQVRVVRTPAPPLHRWFKSLLHALRNRVLQRPATRSGGASIAATADARSRAPHRPASITEWIYTALRTPDIDAGWRFFAFWRALGLVLRDRPHVIYATGGPWTTFLVARDVARVTGLPLVLDFRDPWASNPSSRGRAGMFDSLARRYEASVVGRATRIVANTDVLREALIQAHGEALGDRCVVIHNSYDERDFAAPDPPRAAQLTLSYVGSLYDAHSPEPFLRAVQRLLQSQPYLRQRFRVRLVGAGAPRTAQMVLGLGLDDVVEVGTPVAHAEAIALQRSSHVLLLFLTVPSDYSTFIPGKLFEYVAARRAIFAVTRGGALQRVLQRHSLTPWIYHPDDVDEMAAGLADVVERHESGSLPEPSGETVQRFSSRAAASDLAAVLEAASGREPVAPRTTDAVPSGEVAAAEVR